MEQQELPLKDIHLPEPIGWWPLAPGWWLMLVSVVVLGLVAYWLVRRWRRQTVIKLAVVEFDVLERAELEAPEKLRRLSILLRRIALTACSRTDVAGLTGEAWLKWLDGPLGQPRFSQGPGRLLLTGPYQPATTGDLAELFELCRDWMKRLPGHDREPGSSPR